MEETERPIEHLTLNVRVFWSLLSGEVEPQTGPTLKSEARNPKQIPNANASNSNQSQPANGRRFGFSPLEL